jgi:thiol-disulfide isomerase/thioredoxin
MKPAALTLALAIVVALLAAACSRAEQAPDFTFTVYPAQNGLSGKTMALADLRGKPVVLNFWAGLCPPCRAEMPDFQALHQQYGDRLTILGLDVGPFTGLGSVDQGKALIAELGITYPTASTQDTTVVGRYNVLGMPTTVFITNTGKVFRTWTGYLSKAQMDDLLQRLIKASSG